ncbi:uncharacterized protein LOC144458938 isoform X2 [Epinephelus lanceolatus]
MWKTLSVRIGLLTLAVVMLFSAPEVDANIHLPCCYGGRRRTKEPIDKCYTQEPRDGCHIYAYLLKTSAGAWQCILYKSKWFNQMILAKINCPPATENSKWQI